MLLLGSAAVTAVHRLCAVNSGNPYVFSRGNPPLPPPVTRSEHPASGVRKTLHSAALVRAHVGFIKPVFMPLHAGLCLLLLLVIRNALVAVPLNSACLVQSFLSYKCLIERCGRVSAF